MKVAEKLATDAVHARGLPRRRCSSSAALGSIKKMLGMLPGAGGMKQQLENFDEREIVRTEAIIQSMTPAERRNPKLLNGSRRLRIARGSGMTVTDVNQLVQRFEQAAKMMKTVARGGMPQIPGMGPIPGGGGYGGGKRRRKGRRRRRARARATRPSAPPRTPRSRRARPRPARVGADRFGLRPRAAAARRPAPSEEELAALQKFLGR